MTEVITDALLDTLRLIPILLAVHLLISFFEVKNMKKLRKSKVLTGNLAPLLGTGIALFPQCGFSVIAGELYSEKKILAGTLIAVFIATSDEAIPIIFSSAVTSPELWLRLLLLLGIKIIMALAAGYSINFFLRKRALNEITESDEHSEYGCCGHAVAGAPRECEENEEHCHESEEHEHESHRRHIWHTYFKHPVKHTLIISLYILIVNFILGTAIFLINTYVGENAFENFLSSSIWLQPLFASAVGLIPNCASSVLITEMFTEGTLTLGAAVSGLAVNAGLGLAVLIKENKNIKENIFIVAGLTLYALLAGYVVTAVGLI